MKTSMLFLSLPGRAALALLAAFLLLLGATLPGRAIAATDDDQMVSCLLPGQIHTVAGHATMGARRPVQTSAADCRQRGGEYTVDEHASVPQPVPHVPVATSDMRLVNCLLPRQVRQLGQKARYTTARRPIRTDRSDCASRNGDVISSVQARKALRDYRASQARAAVRKRT